MCIPIFVIFYLGIFYLIRSSHIHLGERVAKMGKDDKAEDAVES